MVISPQCRIEDIEGGDTVTGEQPLSKVPCHDEIQRGLSFTSAFNGGCGGGVLSPMGNILCVDGALVKWANQAA